MKCFGLNNFGQLGQGHNSNLGDEQFEMGNNLTSIKLGSGVKIEICFDISPTSSPSQTFSPSTFDPTFQPSLSFPTFYPSTFSPSQSFNPTMSPTLGVHLVETFQGGGNDDDRLYSIEVDSNDDVIIGGYSRSDLFGISNQGGDDIFSAKYSSNFSFENGNLNGFYLIYVIY